MCYKESKRIFIQQIRFYETNKFSSILQIIGFSIHSKKKDLFVDFKENGALEKIINKARIKLNSTQKLIISYGIACALEFLHNHGIVHLSLNPSNILLDSKFYPYLCEFSNEAIVKTEVECIILNSSPLFMSPGFIAPEYNESYKMNQDSFALDVYAFGMILFILITEENPFIKLNKGEIITNARSGFVINFQKKLIK